MNMNIRWPSADAMWIIGALIAITVLIDGRFDEVDRRFDEVNRRIDDVHAALAARIDDVNATLAARIDDVNARIDVIAADLRALRQAFIAHRHAPGD